MSLDVLNPRLPVVVCYLGFSFTVATTYRARIEADALAVGKRLVSRGAYSAGTYPADRHSGVNGNTFAQMWARIAADVTPWSPEIVVIDGGTNDLPTQTAAQMATSLGVGLAALRAALPNAYLIAQTCAPRAAYAATVSAYNLLGPSVVAAAGARVTWVDTGMVIGDISGDTVHPTTAGYNVMGDALWTLGVQPYLALPRIAL